MKNQTKLYNVFFPVWLMWLLPPVILLSLGINFVVDLAVILITLMIMKVPNIKSKTFPAVFKAWFFGFLSDIIGALILIIPIVIIDFLTNQGILASNDALNHFSEAISTNPFTNIFAVIWIMVCIFISAIFIYMFNKKYTFKKTYMSVTQIQKLALNLAIFTAPYFLLFPTTTFYNLIG